MRRIPFFIKLILLRITVVVTAVVITGIFFFEDSTYGSEDSTYGSEDSTYGSEDSTYDSEDSIFGIRHDRKLSDYEAAAKIKSNEMPDFSPVLCFSYSIDSSDKSDYVGSGILIDPYWIITAGHNFYVEEEQDEPAPVKGIIVLTGSDPENPISTHRVKKLIFHPTWMEQNEDFINANDLCLVQLIDPITEIKPAQIYTTKDEEIGSMVWFCGFGDYSVIKGQDPDLLSKKHAVQNILDRKIDGIISKVNEKSYKGGLLAFDVDDPAGEINSLGDKLLNEDEALLGKGTSAKGALNLEGTTIEGDSGGALFVKDGNTWKIAGVLSGGADEPIEDHKDGSYGDISVFIRLSCQLEWIESVIKQQP